MSVTVNNRVLTRDNKCEKSSQITVGSRVGVVYGDKGKYSIKSTQIASGNRVLVFPSVTNSHKLSVKGGETGYASSYVTWGGDSNILYFTILDTDHNWFIEERDAQTLELLKTTATSTVCDAGVGYTPSGGDSTKYITYDSNVYFRFRDPNNDYNIYKSYTNPYSMGGYDTTFLNFTGEYIFLLTLLPYELYKIKIHSTSDFSLLHTVVAGSGENTKITGDMTYLYGLNYTGGNYYIRKYNTSDMSVVKSTQINITFTWEVIRIVGNTNFLMIEIGGRFEYWDTDSLTRTHYIDATGLHYG